ncbi:transposase [Sulfidibacter corallicola]|uniref:Transposase n=1 Tax=Sulfidibacter corallicola TaxID=2818388 RepID=A0A8A4TPC0_SULCO|nr:transposase [Sulfidibacter corallicola]
MLKANHLPSVHQNCGRPPFSLAFPKYGKSKEGHWSPQIVVALAVTREGFPVRSWVFPGNTADVSTFETIKADLRQWNLGRAILVADAGMNSEENRKTLARACGRYLLACRMANVAEIKKKVLAHPGRFKVISENLQAKEIVIGDGIQDYRYIVCYNPKEAERQRAHRTEVVADLEEKLGGRKNKSAVAKWAVQLRASQRYGRYLIVDARNNLRIDKGAVREAARYDGKWVLQTNDQHLSMEEAAQGYKSLLTIERCFRSLKRSQIRISPLYHWLPNRIESHVKICVLALLIERVAECESGQSWFQIRNKLEKVQATECETKTHRFFRLNRVVPEVKELLEKLSTRLPPTVLKISECARSTPDL